MVGIIAAIRGLLLVISVVSGLWSAINGVTLKGNIDTYNKQVMLAQSGEGAVTALPPGVLDYAATVLPGLLSVVTLFARSYFGPNSTIANVIEQAGKLIPGPKPDVKPLTPGIETSNVETIRALALLSGPLGSTLRPFAEALAAKMGVQGLPVGFDAVVSWEDGTKTAYFVGDHVDCEEDEDEELEAIQQELVDRIADRIEQVYLSHQPAAAAPKPSNN